MLRDRKVAIGLFIFTLFVFYQAYTIPKASIQREIGPGAFPMFLSAILFILVIALWFTAGKNKAKTLEDAPEEAATVQSDTQKIQEPLSQRVIRIVKAIVMLIIYFALMPYLGFLIDTVIFGIAYLIFLYRYKPIKSLIPAFLMALAGYLIFEVALKIPLPAFMEAIK